MVEKYSATQTQVATKVSTKTKVLLGLMIAGCLGGMFAIVSLGLKPKTIIKEQIPTISIDSIASPKMAGLGENQVGYIDSEERGLPGGAGQVCLCRHASYGDHSCDCSNGCPYGYQTPNGGFYIMGYVPCRMYNVTYTPANR